MTDSTMTTARLTLRKPASYDAQWIYELNNDPVWVRFIGNRAVHSVRDARRYIDNTLEHFDEWGYGLWVMERLDTGKPQGMCGLLNRDIFTCPDLGFALLSDARGKGYAQEGAEAILEWAIEHFDCGYITAMAHRDNNSSRKLLGRLGFEQRGTIFMPNVERQVFYWRDMTNLK